VTLRCDLEGVVLRGDFVALASEMRGVDSEALDVAMVGDRVTALDPIVVAVSLVDQEV